MEGFRGAAGACSAEDAFALGKAADLAYLGKAEVGKALKGWGWRGTFLSATDLRGDTQAFVATDGATAVLSFRGTKDPLDFVTDAEFLQAPFGAGAAVAGKVHRGFLKALDVAWPQVRAALDGVRDRGQPLWVTGHSLGAALGTLAVARLRNEGADVAGLCTFGSPAVGDPAFARTFDAAIAGRAFRYVNDLDLVARCPPEQVPGLPPFRHVGEGRWFDAKGGLADAPDPLRGLSVAAALLQIAASGRTLSRAALKKQVLAKVKEPLADHAMEGYLANLDAARKPRKRPAPREITLADAIDGLRTFWGK